MKIACAQMQRSMIYMWERCVLAQAIMKTMFQLIEN